MTRRRLRKRTSDEFIDSLHWLIGIDWRIGAVLTAIAGALTVLAIGWGLGSEGLVIMGVPLELPWWLDLALRFAPAGTGALMMIVIWHRTWTSYNEKMNPPWFER